MGKDTENTSTTKGVDRWNQLKYLTKNPSEQTDVVNEKKRTRVDLSHKDYKALESWRVELVLKHCYPRLDANVSKAMNHLLKSPFCVHPKTGRVCVPIDPRTADSFDPFKVPTVRTLCEEIDEYDKKNPNDKGITSDTDKTALKGAIDIF